MPAPQQVTGLPVPRARAAAGQSQVGQPHRPQKRLGPGAQFPPQRGDLRVAAGQHHRPGALAQLQPLAQPGCQRDHAPERGSDLRPHHVGGGLDPQVAAGQSGAHRFATGPFGTRPGPGCSGRPRATSDASTGPPRASSPSRGACGNISAASSRGVAGPIDSRPRVPTSTITPAGQPQPQFAQQRAQAAAGDGQHHQLRPAQGRVQRSGDGQLRGQQDAGQVLQVLPLDANGGSDLGITHPQSAEVPSVHEDAGQTGSPGSLRQGRQCAC